MQDNLKLIKEVGFDFSWSEKKVWQLDEPVSYMPISDLAWHFKIPFWNEGSEIYNLTPNDVVRHPDVFADEWERIQRADTSYPLDVMQNKGRWLLLDGLHRLTKLHLAGAKDVQVRIIPRTRIPGIMNLEKTLQECIRTLKAEGFPHVYEWTDEPNTKYPAHEHKGNVSWFIVQGSITMEFPDKTLEVITGDRLDVPVGVTHTATVGADGCTFIVGEEIEGDS